MSSPIGDPTIYNVDFENPVITNNNKNYHFSTYSLPRFSYIKIEIDRFNVSWKLEQ